MPWFGKIEWAISRRRRFARLRATALPTFFEQVKPTWIVWSPSLRLWAWRRKAFVPWRNLLLHAKNWILAFITTTRLWSPSGWAEALTCAILASTAALGVVLDGSKSKTFRSFVYADRLLRPWTRRRFRILRPALVAIRERKPWRRLRTRLLGW